MKKILHLTSIVVLPIILLYQEYFFFIQRTELQKTFSPWLNTLFLIDSFVMGILLTVFIFLAMKLKKKENFILGAELVLLVIWFGTMWIPKNTMARYALLTVGRNFTLIGVILAILILKSIQKKKSI